MFKVVFDCLTAYESDFFFYQTISDTVNDLLKLEEEWKKNGHDVTEVPPFHK
jgi:hypothetical protein